MNRYVDPIAWHQSQGYARQACARVFRDGGSPADALKAFGLTAETDCGWSKTVEIIAQRLCGEAQQLARAA
jgi:hypothetical protein